MTSSFEERKKLVKAPSFVSRNFYHYLATKQNRNSVVMGNKLSVSKANLVMVIAIHIVPKSDMGKTTLTTVRTLLKI